MESQISKEAPRYRRITRLAGGCLTVSYLVFCATLFLASYPYRYHFPYLRDNLRTQTASPIPTPHLLAHQPVGNNSIIFDDFSSNARDWGAAYPGSKVEVIDGKLILQSNVSNYFAVATNRDRLLVLNGGRYYVQADFTTSVFAAGTYGLVFGLNGTAGTFYSFDIQPQTAMFRLIKHTPEKWSQLIPLSSVGSAFNSYPEVNTLSAYFDRGAIELYINGNLVSSCFDKEPFQFGGFGAYLDNNSFRLIVDNFFAYSDYR
jgi:hypothetical protein